MQKKRTRVAGNALHPTIRGWIQRNLRLEHHAKAEELVGRFCDQGQTVVAALLIDAERAGKFDDVAVLIERTWKEHWVHQDSEVCGRPDVADNAARIERIYQTFRIPPPHVRKK